MTSARDRLEEALARIADPKGEGARACLTVYADTARMAADAADARARAGISLGPLDGAIVSIGRFVAAPKIFDVASEDLERAIAGYVIEHFSVAKNLLPAVEKTRGGYVMITGSLAYEPDAGVTGLVAIAGAAQSMLARVLMKERDSLGARINEIVIYSSFGRGNASSIRRR